MAENRVDRAIEPVRFDHLMNEPDPGGLGGADPIAREHQPARLADADRGDHVWPDHRRDQAEADLGRAEHGLGAGDREALLRFLRTL